MQVAYETVFCLQLLFLRSLARSLLKSSTLLLGFWRRERFFGGPTAVEQAGITDLMRVPNINRKVAEAIYSALHSS